MQKPRPNLDQVISIFVLCMKTLETCQSVDKWWFAHTKKSVDISIETIAITQRSPRQHVNGSTKTPGRAHRSPSHPRAHSQSILETNPGAPSYSARSTVKGWISDISGRFCAASSSKFWFSWNSSDWVKDARSVERSTLSDKLNLGYRTSYPSFH